MLLADIISSQDGKSLKTAPVCWMQQLVRGPVLLSSALLEAFLKVHLKRSVDSLQGGGSTSDSADEPQHNKTKGGDNRLQDEKALWTLCPLQTREGWLGGESTPHLVYRHRPPGEEGPVKALPPSPPTTTAGRLLPRHHREDQLPSVFLGSRYATTHERHVHLSTA